MKNLTALKPSFVNLILAMSIVAAVFACTSESEEDTPTPGARGGRQYRRIWIAPISR